LLSPALSIVIDVNVIQKLYLLPPKGCYCCGDINYLAKNYHYCLDIRLLTIDLLSLKDSVLEEEKSLIKKDFV